MKGAHEHEHKWISRRRTDHQKSKRPRQEYSRSSVADFDLAHEENQNLNLQTEMVSWDGQYAIFKCSAVTSKGQFVGYGTANSQRDARLAESLIELAETRSVARALRFAGFGLEFTGAEEVSHVAATEAETGANQQQKA